jgi:transposase
MHSKNKKRKDITSYKTYFLKNIKEKYKYDKPYKGNNKVQSHPNKVYNENKHRQRQNSNRNRNHKRRQDLRIKKIRRKKSENHHLREQQKTTQIILDQWSASNTPKVVEPDNMSIKPRKEIERNRNKGFHVETVYITPRYSYNANVEVEPVDGPRVTYGQNWKAYNGAQTQEKYLFFKILHELVSQLKEPKYKNHLGGRPSRPYAEKIYACCVKIYLNFSSRRTISDLRFAQRIGYLDSIPHFNSVLNYLNERKMTFRLNKLITRSALPLREVERHFPIDATGFSTMTFERWLDVKHDIMKIRSYKKAHVQCGAKTNVITAIHVDDGYSSDSKVLPLLVERTAENFIMEEVSADKAYSARKNLKIIFDHGAVPYIPFRRNARAKAKGCAIWNAMFNYYKYGTEDYLNHYHLRSNVETTFSMIKRKLGTNLRSKNDIAQVNEILCKALCHNIIVLIHEIFELGIHVDFSDVTPEWLSFCAKKENI